MRVNETEDKKAQGRKNPNISKAQGSSPKEIL
jgi:hypothetical protein